MTTEPQSRKPGRYDFTAIEAKWQRYWEENQTFKTLNPGDAGADASRPKYYILDMFPYPSGAGLHVGHPLGYCATDIVARYKRMRGFNVLHPMGFDAFGLPAEQYAIETNVHPAVTTRKNIEKYRRQLMMFGFSYDWSREISTCEPDYYQHTQWMFVRMFESWYDAEMRWTDPQGRAVAGRARPIRELVAELESGRWSVDASLNIIRRAPADGTRAWKDLTGKEQRRVLDSQRLAYIDEIPVNWCPALGTVLANEEVDNEGRSERGGHPVFRRPLRQWLMRITKYAERLLEDLDLVDWPESIKLSQRNWIGRSTGAEVVFPLADKWKIENGQWVHGGPVSNRSQDGSLTGCKLTYETFPDAIRIYTTRPDTLFGATYVVLAPEHELVVKITSPDRRREVEGYVAAAKNRSELDRTADTKEKTGVFTGAYAINPVNGWRIPIWVADYVLTGYGTGAIMAVPGSDSRDFEFAAKFHLPIVAVVKPTRDWIEERLAALTADISQTAQSGLDELAKEFPDLKSEITNHRERSAGLSDQTLRVLREKVGIDRLIEHYVRHPQSWSSAFTEDGWAVNSPSEPRASACADVPVRQSAPIDDPIRAGSACDPFAAAAHRSTGFAIPGGVCDLNGLPTPEAKTKITRWLEQAGLGREAVKYKLRDWLFSRQRYWGEPFPILHGEDGEIVALPEEELPLELPDMKDFRPTPMPENSGAMPEPPLGRAREWVHVHRDGKSYRREVNTMPQWAGSCWYYLRFIDPGNRKLFCAKDAENYWMPVDLYVGGAEHAVLHLLYARYWHKVLFDLGFVSTPEPFKRLFNQGMIQSFAYKDARGMLHGPASVEQKSEEQFVLKSTGEPVTRIIAKMSKALKNVVNPDEVIHEYGADTFRLYEMYMGPLDSSKPWNTRDVPGLFKLCQRIWRLVVDEHTGELASALTSNAPDEATLRLLHKTIKKVTEEIEQLKLNTAIAAFFDFVNEMTPRADRPRTIIEPFILLLAPFAPHLAEELWQRLGHAQTLACEPWPKFDESLARDNEVEVAVQVNGKVKTRILIAADADEKTHESTALADEKIVSTIAGKTVRKVIVAKGRLVNIVAN